MAGNHAVHGHRGHAANLRLLEFNCDLGTALCADVPGVTEMSKDRYNVIKGIIALESVKEEDEAQNPKP